DDLQFEFLRRCEAEGRPPVSVVPGSAEFVAAVAAGLGWGMVPIMQLEALDADLVEIGENPHIDVPLYWHHWTLASDKLSRLPEPSTGPGQRPRIRPIVHLSCSWAASTVMVSGVMIECRAIPSMVVNRAVAAGAVSEGSRWPSAARVFSQRCRQSQVTRCPCSRSRRETAAFSGPRACRCMENQSSSWSSRRS